MFISTYMAQVDKFYWKHYIFVQFCNLCLFLGLHMILKEYVQFWYIRW